MTTLLYKDRRLFVDSRAYSGDKVPIGTKNKLHFLSDGVFAGSSVVVGAVEKLAEHLRDSGVHGEVSGALDVYALYVQDNGNVFFYGGGSHWSSLDPDQTLSLGTGSQYVLGALEAGATGEAAMEIACRLDLWSGLPIRSVTIGEPRE